MGFERGFCCRSSTDLAEKFSLQILQLALSLKIGLLEPVLVQVDLVVHRDIYILIRNFEKLVLADDQLLLVLESVARRSEKLHELLVLLQVCLLLTEGDFDLPIVLNDVEPVLVELLLILRVLRLLLTQHVKDVLLLLVKIVIEVLNQLLHKFSSKFLVTQVLLLLFYLFIYILIVHMHLIVSALETLEILQQVLNIEIFTLSLLRVVPLRLVKGDLVHKTQSFLE